MIHEGGHFFFSWFGETIHILGGTLGELIVPLLCAAYVFWRRETTGFAFSIFWFFENFPYSGTYMADARTRALPARSAPIWAVDPWIAEVRHPRQIRRAMYP